MIVVFMGVEGDGSRVRRIRVIIGSWEKKKEKYMHAIYDAFELAAIATANVRFKLRTLIRHIMIANVENESNAVIDKVTKEISFRSK